MWTYIIIYILIYHSARSLDICPLDDGSIRCETGLLDKLMELKINIKFIALINGQDNLRVIDINHESIIEVILD